MKTEYIIEMIEKIGEHYSLYETEYERKIKNIETSSSDFYLIKNMDYYINKKDYR